MNLGGFSIRRFLGLSTFLSNISRAVGVPFTKGGRRRKLGNYMFKLFGF
jgi:hypothetical protein